MEFRLASILRSVSAALPAAGIGLFITAVPLSAEEPAAETTLQLDELVVTTTGFGTPRATHTGNIAKIGEIEMDFIRPVQPAEALNRLPGVGIQQGSGAEHLTAIRSPVLTGGAGAGSFLYLEDGVPMRAAGFANVNALMEAMSEVSGGIEVVRGPGGARYGSNAEHGLINFLSRPPFPGGDAELTLQGGPDKFFSSSGTASRTLAGDNASHGFRGSFAVLHDGGFRANSGLEQQKARLRYDYTAPDTRVVATLTAINTNQETAGFVIGPDAYKNPALYKSNPNPEAYRDAWAVRAAVRMERDIGDDLMLVLTPYARTNAMDFLMHFQNGQPVEQNAHWSAGLLSSLITKLEDGHRIIFGLDSEYTDGWLTEIQYNPPPFPGPPPPADFPQGVHYDYAVKALVLAPYIHSEWRLAPRTLFTAGLRFEYTRYDYQNHAPVGIFGRFLRVADRVDEFADFTPKIGLLHEFNEGLTTYVNLARGTRAPQTTDLYRLQRLQVPGEAKSEELDSIEVGARGRISGITYETNLFYMEKRNYYFRDANGFNVTDGRTDHAGIELELSAPLGAGFDIAAAGTYARHTYAFNNITPSEVILDGNDVDTAPRTLANVRLGYAFNEGAGRAELEWVHMGSYWMDAANTQKYDGHDIVNIRLDYEVTENLALFGKLTNLFDTRYADRADFAFGNERYFPGADRGLYIGATLRY